MSTAAKQPRKKGKPKNKQSDKAKMNLSCPPGTGDTEPVAELYHQSKKIKSFDLATTNESFALEQTALSKSVPVLLPVPQPPTRRESGSLSSVNLIPNHHHTNNEPENSQLDSRSQSLACSNTHFSSTQHSSVPQVSENKIQQQSDQQSFTAQQQTEQKTQNGQSTSDSESPDYSSQEASTNTNIMSLDDLKATTGVTDTQLDREIEDQDLHSLASHFSRPEQFPIAFELDPADCDDFKNILYHQGTRIAMVQALTIWRSQKSKTTFKELVKTAAILRRGDIAKRVCEFARDKVISKSQDLLQSRTRMSSATLQSNDTQVSDFSTGSSENEEDSWDSDSVSGYTNLFELINAKPPLDSTTLNTVKVTRTSTKRMKKKFGCLVNKIADWMVKQSISIDRLTLYLEQIEALEPVSTAVQGRILLFQSDTIDAIEKECKSIEQVLKCLKGYYSWFNYRFIEDIAEVFCEKSIEVQQELTRYKQSFIEYCNKRLLYLPDEAIPPKKDTTQCVFKIEEDWNSMTIKQLKPIKAIIRKVLQLKERAIRLRSVKNGCVELTFDIPAHVANIVFPLSKEKVDMLTEHQICCAPAAEASFPRVAEGAHAQRMETISHMPEPNNTPLTNKFQEIETRIRRALTVRLESCCSSPDMEFATCQRNHCTCCHSESMPLAKQCHRSCKIVAFACVLLIIFYAIMGIILSISIT